MALTAKFILNATSSGNFPIYSGKFQSSDKSPHALFGFRNFLVIVIFDFSVLAQNSKLLQGTRL